MVYGFNGDKNYQKKLNQFLVDKIQKLLDIDESILCGIAIVVLG